MSTPRILVIGYSGAGKTATGEILAEMYGTACTNTGDLIADDWRKKNPGISPQELRDYKDTYRQALYDFAVACTWDDPAYYAREALVRGAVVTGVRRLVEFAASRCHFDLCVWKNSPYASPNETDGGGRKWADVEIPWCNDLTDLKDATVEIVEAALKTPEVYVVGRYRHWLPNGKWDHERMDAMADEEAGVADKLRVAGLRAFCPINTHAPLDDFWGKDSPKRILALCQDKLLRMRHRDAICVRDGWQGVADLEDSAGTEMEIETAVKRGLHVMYTQHGDEALRRACEMLLGTA